MKRSCPPGASVRRYIRIDGVECGPRAAASERTRVPYRNLTRQVSLRISPCMIAAPACASNGAAGQSMCQTRAEAIRAAFRPALPGRSTIGNGPAAVSVWIGNADALPRPSPKRKVRPCGAAVPGQKNRPSEVHEKTIRLSDDPNRGTSVVPHAATDCREGVRGAPAFDRRCDRSRHDSGDAGRMRELVGQAAAMLRPGMGVKRRITGCSPPAATVRPMLRKAAK